jgi:hypothetical protein
MLQRRSRRAEAVAHERREMAAAKKRDGHACRWPACAYRAKKLPIEAAHVFQHRGAGGNPDGSRTSRAACMALCKIHHGLLDHHELEVQALTAKGTDGPCAFFVRAESGRMECLASERSIGVSESRT